MCALVLPFYEMLSDKQRSCLQRLSNDGPNKQGFVRWAQDMRAVPSTRALHPGTSKQHCRPRAPSRMQLLRVEALARNDAGRARGLAKRVIACLDVRANDAGDLVVTKGDQYDVRESTGGNEARLQPLLA